MLRTGDQRSGSQACTVSALPAEPSPLSAESILKTIPGTLVLHIYLYMKMSFRYLSSRRVRHMLSSLFGDMLCVMMRYQRCGSHLWQTYLLMFLCPIPKKFNHRDPVLLLAFFITSLNTAGVCTSQGIRKHGSRWLQGPQLFKDFFLNLHFQVPIVLSSSLSGPGLDLVLSNCWTNERAHPVFKDGRISPSLILGLV